MYTARPSQGERYFLRTLLHHVVGAGRRSEDPAAGGFKELCTDQFGVEHTGPNRFRDACRARGLFSDDLEWHHCMADAAQSATPSHLRHLFVSIITNANGDMVDVHGLYDALVDEMSEDYSYSRRNQNEQYPEPIERA